MASEQDITARKKSTNDELTEIDLPEGNQKPVKYPKQVFFIIGNEFCERFCYYGNRTILSIYLSNMLNFSENNSTIIYQTFVMLCYFFPVLGGIIADCFLGKFRTILYLSILYAIGNVVLAIASQMSLPINHTVFSLLGLFMIALGTGGIKPCVSSFGGDQFKLPEQEKQLASFFSVFYFSINAGSLISTYLTPELRVQSCFGEDTCYPIAFGVPAVLMVVSLIFFVCGKPSYKINKPDGNVMVDVSKCMGRAIKRKITSKEKKEHWLDYAADKYSPQLVHDSKILMELIYLFSPTIIFWALYEQQGSRWIFQAEHMNGKIWGFTIMPDQMQVINPVLIMAFIPLFELAVYPLLAKMKFIRNSMQKLFWGGMIAAVAFGMSAVVEYAVQGAYPDLPGSSGAQLRIYNSYNCSMNIEAVGNSQNYTWTIDSMSMGKYTISPVSSSENLTYSAEFSGSSCPNLSKITDGKFSVYESKSISYIAEEESDGSSSFLTIVRVSDDYDDLDKSDEADPKVRILYRVTETSTFTLSGGDTNSGTFTVGSHATDVYTVTDGTYSLAVNGITLSTELILDVGGVYSLLVDEDKNVTLFIITNPNTVNILWQLPQITVISIAEIMFSITGLEFSYSQAPLSMKSVISSLWLLTDSLGNVIIIFVSAVFGNSSQVYMLSGFAIGMVLVMLVFIALARRYTRAMKKLNNTEHCK